MWLWLRLKASAIFWQRPFFIYGFLSNLQIDKLEGYSGRYHGKKSANIAKEYKRTL